VVFVHDIRTATSTIVIADESAEYYFIIYGTIPESGPMLSCRRIGRVRQYGRKLIKCPYCAVKITDTEANTKVELFPQSTARPIQCQFHLRCPSCKREVGVNIVIRL